MRISSLCASALLGVVAGCGGGGAAPHEPTVPAAGQAFYQGKPLQDYRVYFNNMGNRSATGLVDADGRFVLGTNDMADGAPVGTHHVWFVYDPQIQVEAGKEDQVVIPPPKVKLPDKYGDWAKAGVTVEIPDEGNTDIRIELE